MEMSQTSFFGETIDLSNVAPNPGFEPLPPGHYPVMCISAEPKRGPKGLGVKIVLTVTDGPFQGRKIFDYCIITHENAQAQDIGQRRLREWCDALGVPPNLSDMAPLMNRTLLAKVKIDPARTAGDKTYDAQNRVESFKAYDGMPVGTVPNQQPAQVARPVSAAATAAVAPAPQAAPVATTVAAPVAKKMPWNK